MTLMTADLGPFDVTFPATLTAGNSGTQVILNGMQLTGTDAYGVVWETFDPLDGWDGSPASTLALTQKTRAPGSWTGPRFLGSRSIGLSGTMTAPDPGTAEAALDRLNAAATLDSGILSVQRGAVARSCIVYRQGSPVPTQSGATWNWALDLVAADPRKYATSLSTSTNLPSTTGGFLFPMTFPFVIASSVVSGNCFLTNEGNCTGPVRLQINGPLVGPTVTHVGSGTQLVFASSLTLGASEYLLVDMENQVALGNGQSSRNSSIENRGWFGLTPGANEFSLAAISGTGSMTVMGVPAWL